MLTTTTFGSFLREFSPLWVREGLTREGFDKDTVIIFKSDNGYNRGSHGFGDKVIPYEEGSRAPLIIYDPRLPAEKNGKVCEAVTGNIDMAATIFALAGETAPPMDGKSLIPLLDNPAGKVREALPLFNFWGAASAQSMAIVMPEWKYIHWYYGEGMKPTEELFQLATDPYEMTNGIADTNHAATLTAMRQHYDAELTAIAQNLAPNHGYENYPTLFSRTIPWEQKVGLAKGNKVSSSEGEGETTTKPKKKRKAKK